MPGNTSRQIEQDVFSLPADMESMISWTRTVGDKGAADLSKLCSEYRNDMRRLLQSLLDEHAASPEDKFPYVAREPTEVMANRLRLKFKERADAWSDEAGEGLERLVEALFVRENYSMLSDQLNWVELTAADGGALKADAGNVSKCHTERYMNPYGNNKIFNDDGLDDKHFNSNIEPVASGALRRGNHERLDDVAMADRDSAFDHDPVDNTLGSEAKERCVIYIDPRPHNTTPDSPTVLVGRIYRFCAAHPYHAALGLAILSLATRLIGGFVRGLINVLTG